MSENRYIVNSKNYFSYIFLLLFFSCGILLDPPQEEYYKTKGSKISHEEAVRSVKEALSALILRCPAFINSKFNYKGGYFLQIFPNTCKDEYDPLKGCGAKNFLSRSNLDLCVLLIQTDSCSPNIAEPGKAETRFSSSFSLTFAACAIAFRKSPINLVF